MKKAALVLLTLALLAWIGGCSHNSADPEVAETDIPNFTDEFGGYTTAKVSPGFGDPELIDSENDEVEYDDAMLDAADVSAILAEPESGFFHFRAIWGSLEYDSTITELTDWSGSLTVTRGAEIIRRVIRFEDGQDYIVTRDDRKKIEWVSFTNVHNDGIGVDIIVPKAFPTFDSTWYDTNDDDVDDSLYVDTILPEPVSVTFTTGPYTRTFTLGELALLDTIVDIEDSPNQIAFNSMQYQINWCPRGFMAGFWGTDSTGLGIFLGRWMTHRGFLQGYLKGHYGLDDTDAPVFYGKWIDRTGNFEGFLKGTYKVNNCPDVSNNGNGNGNSNRYNRCNVGWFDGEIYDANSSAIGVLKGHFHKAPYWRAGTFNGRWKLNCPTIADNELDSGL